MIPKNRKKDKREFRRVYVLTMNMASSVIVHNMCSIPLNSPKCYKNENLTLTHSQFLSSKSLLNLNRPSLLSTIHIKNRTIQSSRSAASIVFAAQSNFLKGKLHSLFFFFGDDFWICWIDLIWVCGLFDYFWIGFICLKLVNRDNLVIVSKHSNLVTAWLWQSFQWIPMEKI